MLAVKVFLPTELQSTVTSCKHIFPSNGGIITLPYIMIVTRKILLCFAVEVLGPLEVS